MNGGLRPCPWCRGPATIQRASFGDPGYTAGCVHTCAADPQMCGVMPRTLPMRTRGQAAAAWNRRAGSALWHDE